MKLRGYTRRDLKGARTVIMRVDANVEIPEIGLLDYLKLKRRYYPRISDALSEVTELLDSGFNVVLVSHYGRPKGRNIKSLSLKNFSQYLAFQLDREVQFISSLKDAEKTIREAKEGTLFVLENIRFEQGEETNSVALAKQLAEIGEVYINNAFSVCHRKHASVAAITKYLPSFAGKALKKEVRQLLGPRDQPLTMVLGGIKLETKMPLLLAMQEEIDFLIVGSGLATAFLAAEGIKVKLSNGKKIAKKDQELAIKLRKIYGQRIILPSTLIVRNHGHVRQKTYSRSVGEILDVGSDSFEKYRDIFAISKTVIWNGPLGRVEDRSARSGTRLLVNTLTKQTNLRTMVGGGDTLDYLAHYRQLGAFDVVSHGGGAMLALLAGEKMPGLEVLV